MKVLGIEVFQVELPLVEFYTTALGHTKATYSVIVKIQSESGEGWGEASPIEKPFFDSEYSDSAFEVICKWIAPAIMGMDISSGEDLQKKLSHIKGNNFAKAAVDTAWWDMYARAESKSGRQMIGAGNSDISVGEVIGVDSDTKKILKSAEEAVAFGYRRIKLKIMPGHDYDLLRELKINFPELDLHLDCNGSYTENDFDLLKKIDDLGILLLEQPLPADDLLGHARLQSIIRAPVCLDESIASLNDLKTAHHLQACRSVNIKIGRVGGMTPALGVYKYCTENGLDCWVGGMLESSIGQSFSSALAGKDGVNYPSDIFPNNKFYRENLTARDFELSPGGIIVLDNDPGFTLPPDLKEINQFTVKHKVIV